MWERCIFGSAAIVPALAMAGAGPGEAALPWSAGSFLIGWFAFGGSGCRGLALKSVSIAVTRQCVDRAGLLPPLSRYLCHRLTCRGSDSMISYIGYLCFYSDHIVPGPFRWFTYLVEETACFGFGKPLRCPSRLPLVGSGYRYSALSSYGPCLIPHLSFFCLPG